jgi:kynureninase
LVAEEAIEDALQNDIAVLLLTQVNFRSGKIHNMQRLTELAHRNGILVIWDLAHSAGVLPIQLDDWNVDFAVGCGYKYLNGGPGAPAFLYVAKDHLENVKQPLRGWMGHRSPFEFESSYEPDAGISQFQTGTPAVISMAVLDAALDIFAGLEIAQLRTKSIRLTELFLTLVEQNEALSDLKLLSPRDANERGSQIAFTHASAFAICQALIEQNIITDFRSPNILRIGLSPLILRFEDVWLSVQALTDIMKNSLYEKPNYNQKSKVT